MAQIDGDVQGLLPGRARTRPSARPTRKMQRLGLANLDWLVVRDLQMIETATFWKDGPEIETGELRTEDIGTEVFFLPAAAHTEKDGTFTNTQRLLQWHHKAVDPPGDAAATCGSTTSSAGGSRQQLAGSTDADGPAAAGPDLGLPASTSTASPSADAVLREINGTGPDGAALSAYTAAQGRRLHRAAAAGSTAASTPTRSTRPLRRKPRPGAGPGSPPSGAGRGRPTAASSTTGPPPTRDGHAVERAQEARLVGRRAAAWTGHDVPDFVADQRAGLPCRAEGATGRRRDRRRRPVHHAGRRARPGCSRRPGWPTGRCRRTTSRRSRRCPTRCTRRSRPTRRASSSTGRTTATTPSPARPARGVPVRVHHLPAHRAPHRGRDEPLDLPLPAELQPELFCEVSPQLAARARAGATAAGRTIVTARTAIEARVLVTERMPPLRLGGPGGRTRSALPYHWGRNGLSHRRRGQRPAPRGAGPERAHPGAKAATCDIRPGRRPRGAGPDGATSPTTAAVRERPEQTDGGT